MILPDANVLIYAFHRDGRNMRSALLGSTEW
jgi:hypothetical protein